MFVHFIHLDCDHINDEIFFSHAYLMNKANVLSFVFTQIDSFAKPI